MSAARGDTEGASFALAPTDDQGLTSDRLGELLGARLAEIAGHDPKPLTGQTARNWAKEGMPHRTVDGPRGVIFRFDLEPCVRWARRHKLSAIQGGRRRGAGRKVRDPGRATPSLPIDDAAEKAEQREAARSAIERILAGELDPDRIHLDAGLLKLSQADLQLIAWLEPDVSGFTESQAKRLQQLTRAVRDQMDIARERGQLVPADEVRETWKKHLDQLRARLERLGRELGPQMAADIGAPDSAARIRQLIEAAAAAILEELAGN